MAHSGWRENLGLCRNWIRVIEGRKSNIQMTTPIADLISELDRKLLAEHRYDTALFEELTAMQRSGGILHGDRPICPFLRPYFLSGRRYAEIRRAARVLFNAFRSMTHAALADETILDVLGVSDKEARWARLDPGYEDVSVNSRLDTFLNEDGFAFLEYNGENPAGIGDQSSLQSLFSRVPAVREFLSRQAHHFPQPKVSLVNSIESVYREFGGQKAAPNIAIVDWAGVDTRAEFTLLADYFQSRGYNTNICDPRELEYHNGVLRAGSFEIDIFFKRVIIHEFLEHFDEEHAVYRALSDGSVCMVNAFRSKLPHKKASFAVLTDERFAGLFTPEQLEVIRRHVPWTRVVREGKTGYGGETIDLIGNIRSKRERFVLKPNDDYGGHGITFGWECTESEWDDALQNALTEKYVVQERVRVTKAEMPVFDGQSAWIESLNVDFDPFLFGENVEGGMVRLGKGSLVNISSGGNETALAILEDI